MARIEHEHRTLDMDVRGTDLLSQHPVETPLQELRRLRKLVVNQARVNAELRADLHDQDRQIARLARRGG